MKTYIALLRGINVGGSAILPMKDLKDLLEGLGCMHVKTYIQSGNAVFKAPTRDSQGLAVQIGAAIQKSRGFEPKVLVLEREELAQAAAANPFSEAQSEPKTFHLFFMAAVPAKADRAGLKRLCKDSERFAIKGRIFYLYAPDGIGRSCLAAGAEKLHGVPVTARNWRIVVKLLAMAGAEG